MTNDTGKVFSKCYRCKEEKSYWCHGLCKNEDCETALVEVEHPFQIQIPKIPEINSQSQSPPRKNRIQAAYHPRSSSRQILNPKVYQSKDFSQEVSGLISLRVELKGLDASGMEGCLEPVLFFERGIN